MTTIDRNTKISELIRVNSKSIDAIASIAKPLEKLKNPILRKIMASRVSIAEAAKMGGTTVEEFANVLAPLGFQFAHAENPAQLHKEKKPEWLTNAKPGDIRVFDVRPIIENGADPLKEILGQFKNVEAGKILSVINSFIPTPLIHLLKKEKAEDSFVETVSDQEFHTFFLKKNKETASSQTSDEQVMMHDERGFEEILNQFAPGHTREIDVRGLEMPGPMQTILSELETLPEGHALYINHKRVPVYLLEELADKKFEVHIHNVAESNVKMLIFRQ